MISALDKKLLRELWQMRSQAMAISLVIAAGVGTFIMALCAIASLGKSRDQYYDRHRFAAIFAPLKRAPELLRHRIEQIPGVNRVETRIVLDVTLDIPGMIEPATGRLNSLPENGISWLNQVYIKRGRSPEPGRPGQVLCSDAFATAHQLHLGDRITAVINGRFQTLTIVGIALSPEYIIQIPPGKVLPDDRMFGVFWMNRRELEAAYDMKGAFNYVCLGLTKDASEPDVVSRLDSLLSSYGGIGAFGRSLQTSHLYLSDEMRQLNTMAMIAPTIFLSVAAFLLHMVIARIVGMQREQIAALKAFGYDNAAIAMHYLKLVLLITLIGSTLGILFGAWLGHNLTEMYARFYKFPVFYFELDRAAVVGALVLGFSAAIVGTLSAVLRAVRLPPAQAMRPEPPSNYRQTIIERLGLGWIFPQTVRMMLRNLERKPVKSGLACLGIALAFAVLVLGTFTLDAVNFMMDFQFRKSQLYDLMVTLREPTDAQASYDLRQLPGVLRCEPFRNIQVQLVHQHLSKRVAITGLEGRGDLFRLLDVDAKPVDLPSEGLILNDKLAQVLQVNRGDWVDIQLLEGDRRSFRQQISGIIREFGGMNAYMQRSALNRLLREEAVLSGAFLMVDKQYLESLYQAVKVSPRIAAVTIRESALRSFQDTVAENLMVMRTFNILFAVVIAFGVVYNNARITFSERSRELATLRVMGFTRFEVAIILLGELAILTLVAIPLGAAIGYAMAAYMVTGMDTENYRIPLIVENSTYAFATVIVCLSAAVSGLIVQRQIRWLDLVGVLKTKE